MACTHYSTHTVPDDLPKSVGQHPAAAQRIQRFAHWIGPPPRNFVHPHRIGYLPCPFIVTYLAGERLSARHARYRALPVSPSKVACKSLTQSKRAVRKDGARPRQSSIRASVIPGQGRDLLCGGFPLPACGNDKLRRGATLPDAQRHSPSRGHGRELGAFAGGQGGGGGRFFGH